jgi:uncharacterized protein YgbK (DUF1537 family)
MARHPVTPMTEADIRRHLAAQTARAIGLVDALALWAGSGAARLEALRAAGVEIVLIDVLDEASLVAAGRLVWENRGARLFGASSSGLQYALVAYWQAAGLLPSAAPPEPAAAVERLLVVSGSCSPATAAQLRWLGARGGVPIRLDVRRLLAAEARDAEIARAALASRQALADGRDPLVFTAEGPGDPALAAFEEARHALGLARETAQGRLGEALGAVLRTVLEEVALRRVLVAGGDTSGLAAGALDLFALTAIAPLAPGSPLCRGWSDLPARDGLEIVLKGGQVGGPDYLGAAKAGRPLPA